MFNQLPLGMSIPDNITFDNFIMGCNSAVVNTVIDLCNGVFHEQYLYLWGVAGVGKTHLSQAICHALTQRGLASTYIPLKQASQLNPILLQDLHVLPFIVIDDVEAIAGQTAWEEALFGLYQRALESKTKIIWTANCPPVRLPIKLKDLQSRLAASLVLEIQPLTDADKVLVLQQRADARGLTLPDNVAHYLLARYPRHISELLKTLDKLDKSALVAQRALTIPFVKQALSI